MITVNPCERLRIKEIKNHPWLRNKIPIYSKLITLAPTALEHAFLLDNSILNQVRSYNMESLKSFHDV
jgi:hypothetical protein